MKVTPETQLDRFRSQAGVTLVELMIVVFTGGLLLVTAMGVMLNVAGTSSNFTLSLDTEIEELNAVNALQLMFAQSAEVKYSSLPSLNTYTNGGGVGAIRNYNSDADFGVTNVSTLAVFMRDRQVSSMTAPSTLVSDFAPTAVFFQAPTPTTWGVLYIALGGGGLVPSRSELHFEGLVGARIENISTYTPFGANPTAGDPVTSFDMTLIFRRFLGAVTPEKRMFCPVSNLSACPGIGAFHDVSRVFKVTLRNNVLMESPNSPLNAATPAIMNGRMFDLIQFFALGYSGGLQ